MRLFTAAVACAAAFLLAGCTQEAPSPAASPTAIIRAGACPTSLGTQQDVADPAHDTNGLVPAQPQPSAAAVCEYRVVPTQGTSARRTLAKQLNLTSAPATELASAASRIDTGTSAGTSGCPSDTGSVTIIVFSYRSAAPVDLWWHSTGCQTIDNGSTTANQVANDSFADFQTVFKQATRSAH